MWLNYHVAFPRPHPRRLIFCDKKMDRFRARDSPVIKAQRLDVDSRRGRRGNVEGIMRARSVSSVWGTINLRTSVNQRFSFNLHPILETRTITALWFVGALVNEALLSYTS